MVEQTVKVVGKDRERGVAVALTTEHAGSEADDELRGVTTPTLTLLGERTLLYDAAQVANRIHALMPAARAEVVPGAGHDLPVYSPDLVTDRAIEFADRAETAARPG